MKEKLESISAVLENMVYSAAIDRLEALEREKLYTGNSHHWAQEITGVIVRKLLHELPALKLFLKSEDQEDVGFMYRLVTESILPGFATRVRVDALKTKGNPIGIFFVLVDSIVTTMRCHHRVPELLSEIRDYFVKDPFHAQTYEEIGRVCVKALDS